MAKRKNTELVMEVESKRANKDEQIVDLTNQEEQEQKDSTDELVIREIRDLPPVHYLFKIKNFSLLLSDPSIEYFESTVFEVSGYKWTLCVYPKGVKDNSKHISLFLVLSESNAFTLHHEVNVYFKLFVYNQIDDKYLAVQDAKGRISRFRGTKTEWGFNQLLPLDVFNDASNGYLIDDCCVFGAEIFVVQPPTISKGECATIVKYLSNNTYSWNVQNFKELYKQGTPIPCTSEVFLICGYKWRLNLYPNGCEEEKGKSLCLYLQLMEEPFNYLGHTLSVEFGMLVIDQLCGKHHKQSGGSHFSQFSAYTGLEWGVLELIPLDKLNDASEGYLVDGAIVLQVQISRISIAKEFS